LTGSQGRPNARDEASVFGQADPTDGRQPYDWKSKYEDPAARREMWIEAIYLGALLFLMPFLMILFWLEWPKGLLHLSDERYRPLAKYAFAWTSGTLGGVLFDLKWLYHSVARGSWHIDRRLWRIFTPHISGGLSFFVLALIASGTLRIFDTKATDSHSLIVGLGFLVGYFSDSAIAKLAEIAETLFGTIRAKEKHLEAPARAIEKPDETKRTE
jgi:hypothetical protein